MKVKKKVMEDPGHGGHDPGAIGLTGVQEKIITLAVARMLADILASVADVRLTRDTDKALGATLSADLKARADAANDWEADCFISVHCNSATDRAAHGCEVWTTPGWTGADVLAEAVLQSLRAEFPDLSYRMDYTDGDGDKEARFAVLTQTKMPACLVELAFISNPTEETMLESPAYQDRAARAIAEGICDYLGVQLPPADPDAVRIMVAGQVLTGKLIDGRSWVSVRDMAEALGKTVGWDGASRTVTVK